MLLFRPPAKPLKIHEVQCSCLGNHRAETPLENVRGGAVCTLQLLLRPALCLEAIRIIASNIGGHQSTSFGSMITKDYVEYQLVVVDIKIFCCVFF